MTGEGDAGPTRVDPAVHRRVVAELRAAATSSPRTADRRHLEALITDAAAVAMSLERERLLAKRQARAALVDAERDASVAREADALEERARTLGGEVAELRELMARVRGRFARPV